MYCYSFIHLQSNLQRITKQTGKQGNMHENKEKHKTLETDSQRLQILKLLETENKIAIYIILKKKRQTENMSMRQELLKDAKQIRK